MNNCSHSQCSMYMLRPLRSPMQLDFIHWRLTFHIWSPAWPLRCYYYYYLIFYSSNEWSECLIADYNSRLNASFENGVYHVSLVKRKLKSTSFNFIPNVTFKSFLKTLHFIWKVYIIDFDYRKSLNFKIRKQATVDAMTAYLRVHRFASCLLGIGIPYVR